ncbi:condensation domain-containing protein, partial [Streptomyces lavendulae]
GLARHLDTTDRRTRTPLTRRTRPRTLPLSHAQKRLWLLNEIEGPNSAYTVPVAVALSGPVDADALRAALRDLAVRHESLRTVFGLDDEGPFQLVRDAGAARRLPLEQVGVAPDELDRMLAEYRGRPFDLEADLPVRAVLFTVNPEEHVLLLVIHHIAADGWSLAPLGQDLSQAYAARLHGHAPDWEPLPVQYADYTLWQHELLDGDN